MNVKSKIALATLSLVANTAAFAQAVPAAPANALTYNIGAVSQYRFRGIEQTSGQPAIHGGIDFAHKSGAYLGAWASNVNWIKDFNGSSKGDFEIDFYGGVKGEIAKGLAFDVGLTTYQYPGNDSGAVGTPGAGGFTNASTTEFYGALTYSIVTVKYSQSLGDFLGNINSNASRYWEIAATLDLTKGYSLTPHVGRQTIPNQNFGGAPGVAAVTDGSAANYTDYALTLGKDFGGGWSASLAYLGTDAKDRAFYQAGFNGQNRFLGSNAVVIGAKYSF